MSESGEIPAPFVAMFSGLREVRTSAPRNPAHPCFGCGPTHEFGLRVRCFESESGVLSPIIVPSRLAGLPGVAHGGIVATYLDEVLAAAALRHGGQVYVTGELTVTYFRPTPVDRPLVGRGRVTKDWGRFMELEGQLEDLHGGEALATATGRFFPMAPTDPAGSPR